MSIYRVNGRHAYHNNPPGSVFPASLDPDAERRAVARGALVILDSTPPGLVPGTYRPPDGWEHITHELEAPTVGPLSLKGALPNG